MSALTSILPTHRLAGQHDGSLHGWPCSAWHRLGPRCAACCPKILHPGAKMTFLKPNSQSCQLPASTSRSSHGRHGEPTPGPSPGAFTPSPRRLPALPPHTPISRPLQGPHQHRCSVTGMGVCAPPHPPGEVPLTGPCSRQPQAASSHTALGLR